MAIVGAIMVPHPPLIIPQVGRGGEQQIFKTTRAYEEAAAWLMNAAPETLVIISPHSAMYGDYLHVSPGNSARGDFSQFGAPDVRFEIAYDMELAREAVNLAQVDNLPAGFEGERQPQLDHATMVPLFFLQKAAGSLDPFSFVRLGLSGLSFAEHYRMGMCIAQAAEKLGRRVGVVASGDLSHYGRHDGPYGFRKEGPEYDSKLMDIMGRAAFLELLLMSEPFCERAGECGQRSFLIMAGCLDGKEVTANCLSYEGVTGVGYGVCAFEPAGEDPNRRFLTRKEDL
jgi:AmmeMemoRadiSam system protein B